MARPQPSPSSRSRRRPARQSVSATPAPQQLPRAGIAVRLISLVYDALLLIALIAVTSTLLIAIATPGQAASAGNLTVLSPGLRHGLLFPAALLVIFGFYGYCWTRSGQTLGMQTWRLETRRRDGRRLGWVDSLRRFMAAGMVPLLCGLSSWLVWHTPPAFAASVVFGLLINYLWRWLPDRLGGGRCLHDQLSSTEVLRVPGTRRRYRFLGLFGDKED